MYNVDLMHLRRPFNYIRTNLAVIDAGLFCSRAGFFGGVLDWFLRFVSAIPFKFHFNQVGRLTRFHCRLAHNNMKTTDKRIY